MAVLLMNTNGPSLGPDTAEKRQTAFKKLVDDLKPSIIFTQECNSKFRKCLERPDEYAQIPNKGGADAGFIYNTNDFEADIITDNPSAKPTKNLMLNCPCTLRAAKPDRTSNPASNESALDALMLELNIKNPLRKDFSFTSKAQLKVTSMPDRQPAVGRDFSYEFRVKLNIENPLFNDFDFTDDRAQVVRFTSKPVRQPALDFLAISWHGVHKWTEEQKKTFIRRFFTAVKKLRNKWNMPVIVGGDFNLGKKLWPKLPEDFRIHDYTKSKRRSLGKKALIDLFVSTGGLNLTHTECYDLRRIKCLVLTHGRPKSTRKMTTWLESERPPINLAKITIQNPLKSFDFTDIKIQNPEGFDLTKLKILKPEGLTFTSTNTQIEHPEGAVDCTEIKIRNPDRFDLTNIKIQNPEGFDLTKLEIIGSNFFNLPSIEVLNPQGYDLTKISNARDFFDHDPVQAYLTAPLATTPHHWPDMPEAGYSGTPATGTAAATPGPDDTDAVSSTSEEYEED